MSTITHALASYLCCSHEKKDDYFPLPEIRQLPVLVIQSRTK